MLTCTLSRYQFKQD